VVQAVSSESLSRCISLLTGKSRDLGPRSRMGPRGMLHHSLCLACRDGPSKRKKNRESSRDIREFKFPVTVLSSESFLVFCDLSRKASQIPTT
jgi:hypothetical protein